MAIDSSRSLSGYVWLLLYFIANLTLTLHNKYVMSMYSFSFPWALTGIHCFFGFIGCYTLNFFNYFRAANLSSQENFIILVFSVLYTLNIAVSNISLNLVTVPFHQVVRATAPIFIIILSIVFLNRSFSKRVYASLIPVVFGVALATFGDYYFTVAGFALTVLGTVLAAIKTIVTNRIQAGNLKLHPLDLLLRMSPLALIQTIFYSYCTGEFSQLSDYLSKELTTNILYALLMNGMIAFLLNIVSFTANKKTSALTMTVAANIKQVLAIILSVVIFNLKITEINGIGIFISLLGGAYYTFVELEEKKHAAEKMYAKVLNTPFVEEMEKMKSTMGLSGLSN